MIPDFSCGHPLWLFLAKNFNSLMKFFWDQLLSLFFWLCHFFFFISNFPFFCYSPYFHLLSFLLSLFLLLPFAFVILTFPASVSTAFYILLDTLLSLLLLFSSQFQDCDEQAIAFPKLPFTSVLWSYLSPSFLYALDSRYSLLPYAQLVFPC